MRLLVFYILLFFLNLSCSLREDFTEVKDNTSDLKGKIDYTNTTATELVDILHFLNYRVEDFNYGLRDDLSKSARNEAWAALKNKNIGDEERVLAAAFLFSAFRYQHWLGDGEDDIEIFEDLLADDFKEFFGIYEGLVMDDLLVDNLFVESPTNALIHQSLATVLHHKEKKHIRVMEYLELEPKSFYDYILQVLQREAEFNEMKDMPEYVRVILENKHLALYLLQWRHNAIALGVVSQLTGIEDQPSFVTGSYRWTLPVSSDLGTKIKRKRLGVIVLLCKYVPNFCKKQIAKHIGLDVRIDHFTNQKLEFLLNYIRMAKESRQALYDLGIEPQDSEVIHNIVLTLNVEYSSASSPGLLEWNAKRQKLEIDLVNELKSIFPN